VPDPTPEHLDVSGRPTRLRAPDLDRFFEPRVLAVLGASDTPGRPNALITRRLQEWAEHKGVTFRPVNPNRPSVNGVACVPKLTDVPEAIDVVALLTGDVTAAVREAIDAKAGFAVAFGSGFAETGARGRRAQDELTLRVSESDLHLLGPNTNLNAFEDFRPDLDGPAIALISQSGHQGRPIFQAQELGIAVCAWAPTGNEADLEFADFAGYFAGRPEVGVIAAYIEGFKDGRTLMLAADRAVRAGTPIVMVKVGRTPAGSSMAGSHTGKLTGSDAVTDAVFRQFGVTRVDGLDELLDTSHMLARARPPARRDPGVAIYAISGGTGAHLADLCQAAGLRLPRLPKQTQAELHQWIPTYLRVSNPIDNGGHPVGDERGRRILDALVAEPAIDALICPITGAFPPMSDRLAQDLVDVAETTDKPVCVIWGSPVGTEAAYRDILLSSSKVIVFRTFGNCVGAVKAWADHHELRSRYRSPFARVATRPSPARDHCRARLAAASGPLSERSSKELVAAYGIPVSRDILTTTAAEATRAARAIGYPVVLKVCSPDIAHKTDLGLVRVGLKTATDVREAFHQMADLAAAHPDAVIEGILVSEQLDDGIEAVIGLSTDALFGPTVMVGLGGVLVEVLGDVAVRVPPFDRREARRMIDELRGVALLRGARGRPAADIDALVDIIMKVQRLGTELIDDVFELDLNPVLVRPEGRGAVALDALVIPKIKGS
jgi:acetate---CoA ligase (ADP-forming)